MTYKDRLYERQSRTLFFYDLYHAYQWRWGDSFRDGDLKRNIINTAVFGETVKIAAAVWCSDRMRNYNDNGFDPASGFTRD